MNHLALVIENDEVAVLMSRFGVRIRWLRGNAKMKKKKEANRNKKLTLNGADLEFANIVH